MRYVAALALLVACGEPPTPEEAIADRAAEGDTDCGKVYVLSTPGRSTESDAARACVIAARAEARPFHVAIQTNFVFYAWVDNGRDLFHMSYSSPDDEPAEDPTIRWTSCSDLADLGADCAGTSQYDLCFVCVQPF